MNNFNFGASKTSLFIRGVGSDLENNISFLQRTPFSSFLEPSPEGSCNLNDKVSGIFL